MFHNYIYRREKLVVINCDFFIKSIASSHHVNYDQL